jgi:hypothetical protein
MIEDLGNINEAVKFLDPLRTLADLTSCIRNSCLSPLNFYADMLNESMLACLPNNERMIPPLRLYDLFSQLYTVTNYSFNCVKEDETNIPNIYPATTMDNLTLQCEQGVPQHELKLHQGCICTIMRNLDIKEDLVENRGVVVECLN